MELSNKVEVKFRLDVNQKKALKKLNPLILEVSILDDASVKKAGEEIIKLLRKP